MSSRLQQLDRDLLLVLLIVANRLEDLAHAAAAGFVDDAIRAEALSDPLFAGHGAGEPDALRGLFFDECSRGVVSFEQ